MEQVATPEGWRADPTLVTNFYNYLRRLLVDARPNEGHRGLVALEEQFDVTIVTQKCGRICTNEPAVRTLFTSTANS